MHRTSDLERFEAAVSEHMLRRYGITWTDASGDTKPLLDAIEDGVSPESFVIRWGEKYDLPER